MATGEVTLDGAEAHLIGEPDHGFAQMTAMLNISRLHNAITSAAVMRRGWMLASAYAREREAFGRHLDEHPLQRRVLDTMESEADGALYLTMRMAQLLGRIECRQVAGADQALFRVGIALAKLATAKQAVAVASEAIECFGGQGYMEDTGLPRLLRDAQVLPIWEGTTNVLSLDLLRVLARPDTIEAVAAEFERLQVPAHAHVTDVAKKAAAAGNQADARAVAFRLADAWMTGLLSEAGREYRPLAGIRLQ
jgi:alkylation response protein AidB-like acyl-CoA dehydrogenase